MPTALNFTIHPSLRIPAKYKAHVYFLLLIIIIIALPWLLTRPLYGICSTDGPASPAAQHTSRLIDSLIHSFIHR